MTGRAGSYVSLGGFRNEDKLTFAPNRLALNKIDILFGTWAAAITRRR